MARTLRSFRPTGNMSWTPVARGCAAGHGFAPLRRWQIDLQTGDSGSRRQNSDAENFRGESARWRYGHLRRDLVPEKFQSEEKISGHRGHLRRAAGFVHAEKFPHNLSAATRS